MRERHRATHGDGVIVVLENRELVDEVRERRRSVAEFGNDFPWRSFSGGQWPWTRAGRQGGFK